MKNNLIIYNFLIYQNSKCSINAQNIPKHVIHKRNATILILVNTFLTSDANIFVYFICTTCKKGINIFFGLITYEYKNVCRNNLLD